MIRSIVYIKSNYVFSLKIIGSLWTELFTFSRILINVQVLLSPIWKKTVLELRKKEKQTNRDLSPDSQNTAKLINNFFNISIPQISPLTARFYAPAFRLPSSFLSSIYNIIAQQVKPPAHSSAQVVLNSVIFHSDKWSWESTSTTMSSAFALPVPTTQHTANSIQHYHLSKITNIRIRAERSFQSSSWNLKHENVHHNNYKTFTYLYNSVFRLINLSFVVRSAVSTIVSLLIQFRSVK